MTRAWFVYVDITRLKSFEHFGHVLLEMYWSLNFQLSHRLSVTTLIVLYILVQPRVSCASVTPTIGVGTRRIRVTCHDESGEHLTGSGDLTNQSGAHPTASGKCEKLYSHPNRWGGITTESGILCSSLIRKNLIEPDRLHLNSDRAG